MELSPFLLDRWLAAYEFRTPPPAFNLASSTGPIWTLRDVEALGNGLDLSNMPISYAPPDGGAALREAIAAHHDVDPDWVVVTTGASEAFSILFCLASKPGGKVVLPDPAFPAFAAMARAWQLDVATYDLARDQQYRQSTRAVLDAIDKETALAFVNTPHNPTGAVMPHSEIGHLADALRGFGVPLIVDEVYHPLYFSEPQPSAANIENVIVIGDMSKALSLAGLRVGWIIDANAERRERIVNARSYFTVSGSPLNEAIATHALLNRDAILARLQSVTSRNLASLRDLIADAGGIWSWIEPQGSTTAFPWFSDGRNSRAFCEALAEQGVLMVPGDCFGRPEHIRIGFGALANGFDSAMAILRRALTS